jgi:predicted 3-demethylubiquinone-9 3-methyltransferase (glyoxalase superfamily)
MQKITPFLWFNGQAEEAANFYVSVFKNSAITKVVKYKTGSPSPMPEGSLMTISFTIEGVEFTALNGGPEFQFSQATSFVVNCNSQEEVDYYWDKLSEGGETQACGWLKDKYGLAWQITPVKMIEMIADPDPEKGQRVFSAMLQMTKLDLPTLEKAYNE